MPSVTRKPRVGRAERQEQRREEIRGRVLTALEAILDDGTSYTEMSVERLIRETGVARSTFYAYFEDKGDLLLGLAGDVVDELLAAAEPWLELRAGSTDDDLAEALRGFVETYVTHRVVLAAIAETAAHDPRVESFLAGRLDELVRHLAEHLAEGRATGFVREAVDPPATAVWVAALLERGLHQMLGPGRPDDVERAVDGLSGLLWNALYRSDPA